MRTPSVTAFVAALLTLPLVPHLQAQEPHRLGLNLSVVGSQRLGVTYHLSDAVTVRPAVGLDWFRSEAGAPLLTTRTSYQYGLMLDLLFPLAGDPAVTPYVGTGGELWFQGGLFATGSTAHTVTGAALFGLRVQLVTRLHVYGEVSLRYGATRGGGQHTDRLNLFTAPLGVLIYLK